MGLRRLFSGSKAIFFTLIAVSLLGIVLFSYSVFYSYSLQEKASLTAARVETMNRFLKEVDADMENAIYIASYRALISLEDHLATEGQDGFVDSTETAFTELFLNGTLDGEPVGLMENNTFPYWAENIGGRAEGIGIVMSFSAGDVSIYQTSPWTVTVSVEAFMNISDMKSTASWSSEKSLSSEISIIGFEDPWYAVYTNNQFLRRINITVYEGNYTDDETNMTNIQDHVARTLYSAFNASPSFLQRFEGDFAPSEFGIESFVDESEIGEVCGSASSVDSLCWSQNFSVTSYPVGGWPGFRIDNSSGMDGSPTRLQKYMMEDYIIK